MLADIGYFVAVDIPELGGYAAQAQTYIVSIGMICVTTLSFLSTDMGTWAILWSLPFWTIAVVLFSSGIVNKIVWLAFGGYPEFVIADGSAEWEGEPMLEE